MNQHLIEISRNVAGGTRVILMMDQAGWHLSNKLAVPENITIVPLPPRSSELNPVENIWQFMRDNWLSNRVFKSYGDIVDHCCYAWRTLQEQPLFDAAQARLHRPTAVVAVEYRPKVSARIDLDTAPNLIVADQSLF